MSEVEKYFEQFRGDLPTYEQAVLLSDPVCYSPDLSTVPLWVHAPQQYDLKVDTPIVDWRYEFALRLKKASDKFNG
jgi:hypothetical protein